MRRHAAERSAEPIESDGPKRKTITLSVDQDFIDRIDAEIASGPTIQRKLKKQPWILGHLEEVLSRRLLTPEKVAVREVARLGGELPKCTDRLRAIVADAIRADRSPR